MILFAYATNMNVEGFTLHVKSAKKICNARLPGYVFTPNRTGPDDSSKSNIVHSDELDAAVWGVLIDIDDADRDVFYFPDDTLELAPVTCEGTDGKTYPAEVFVSLPHATNNYLLPYDWYREKLVTFARKQGLPEEYIHTLEAMEVEVDPDENRKARRLKKLGEL